MIVCQCARCGGDLPPGLAPAWELCAECRDLDRARRDPKTGHRFYRCPPECPNPGRCNYCDGGLGYCVVCHQAEGDLAPRCPGRA